MNLKNNNRNLWILLASQQRGACTVIVWSDHELRSDTISLEKISVQIRTAEKLKEKRKIEPG